MSYVIAGGPVRNRGWILSRSIDAIWANDHVWALHYLWGDCVDDTENVLKLAKRMAQNCKKAEVTYEIYDTHEPNWERGSYSSAVMGGLRNRWVKQLEDEPYTHLWVVDSDVIPAKDVLSRLLAVDKPVVGAFVPIADGKTPIHMTHFVIDDPGGFKARRMGDERHKTTPHPVTLVGGCYLIRREVFENGEMWGEHPQGEDGFFGDRCREHGIEMWVDPMAKCEHVMEKP